MQIKSVVRKLIRNVLHIRINETVSDGINRHYYKIKKQFIRKRCSKSEFEKILDSVDINKGQTLIVHCSWRAMYSLDASPNEVIDILLKKIGKCGTLLMPCYAAENEVFDVYKSPSAAGVLSECLRQKEGAIRSDFPKFSMCGIGENANDILYNHQFSEYQFDDCSPYAIATKKYNAKILMLGFKTNTHKISVFHCATYDSRNLSEFYSNCFKRQIRYKKANGEDIIFTDRTVGCQNNKSAFCKLFSKVPKMYQNSKGISVISFDAITAYEIAYDFCLRGGIIYKFNN